MRLSLLLIFFIVCSASVFSQDHIITKKGKDLVVNITEIRQTDVTFTMFNDTSKTPFVMDKAEIEKVVFKNGVEERFGNGENETIINNNSTNKNTTPDKIFTMDGRVIYCEVVELKRFGVNYIPVKSSDNYVEYLANTKIDRIEYANGNVDYISGAPDNPKNRKDPKDFSFLSPNFISLNVGPALPFGLFAGIVNSGSSITTVGMDINFDATYYLFRGMGFGITGGYLYNPTNYTQEQTLRTIIQGNIPAGTPVTIDAWHTGYVMAGLGYYNEYKRLLIDYKAMFGAIFSFFPTSRATYNDGSGMITSTFSSESVSYIFGGQVTARYFLTRKFQLKFNVSTLFGRASFQSLIRTDQPEGQPSYQWGVVAYPFTPMNMSWLNFTFGAAYTLGK